MTARAIPTRRVKRGADACQLCRCTWDGRQRPQAAVTVVGIRICLKHLEILMAILEGR